MHKIQCVFISATYMSLRQIKCYWFVILWHLLTFGYQKFACRELILTDIYLKEHIEPNRLSNLA